MKKIFSFLIIMVLAHASIAQHTVVLKSGEKMNGKVQSLKDGVINFDFKGNVMKLNVSDVSSISFGESADNGAAKNTSEPIKKEPGEKQVVSGSYLVRYKVADRTIARPPQVSNLTQDKGTVVVDIS